MYRAHLERLVRTRLEESLLDEGVLPRDRVESAQLEQDQSGKLLSDVLVDADMMDEWDLAKLVCGRFGLPFIDVKGYTRRREVADLLPREWCLKNGVLPLDQFGQTIMLACQEIPSAELVREIVERTGCSPFLYVGVRRAIREVLDEQVRKPAVPAKPAPAAAKPGQKPAEAPAKPAEPAAPAIDPAPPTRTLDLPPLDLPAISMRLDATPAAIGAEEPRKPAIQRFQRSIGSSTGEPAAAAEKSPAAGRKSSSPATGPVAPAGGPKLAARTAPVVPAAPHRAASPGPGQQSWQSIFDVGEDNVRRTRPGTENPERAKKTIP